VEAYKEYLSIAGKQQRPLINGFVKVNRMADWKNQVFRYDVDKYVQQYHQIGLQKVTLITRGNTVLRRKYRGQLTVEVERYYTVDKFRDWLVPAMEKAFADKYPSSDDNGQSLYEGIAYKNDFIESVRVRHEKEEKVRYDYIQNRASEHRHQQMRASQEARERNFE
jgi:hypothetical protein